MPSKSPSRLNYITKKLLKNLQEPAITPIFATLFGKTKAIQDDSLAQLVEHNTFNVGVLGSSPRRITENKKRN